MKARHEVTHYRLTLNGSGDIEGYVICSNGNDGTYVPIRTAPAAVAPKRCTQCGEGLTLTLSLDTWGGA